MSETTIRPLTHHESGIYHMNKKDAYFISYVLRVSTPRAITPEEGLKVTKLLYKKCPILRLRVVENDDETHLAYMKHEDVDFKVIENADVFKTYNDMPLEYSLNLQDGPLWCVRLLPYSPDQDSYIEETSSTDGEKPRLQSFCHFVLVFCHTITDGYSCVRIVRALLSLINDVMSGTPIDESKQIGKLIDVGRENQLIDKLEKDFKNDPELLKRRKDYLCSFAMETVFEKAFPVAPLLKPKTVCKLHVVDEIKSKKFIDRCKKEGVTVHTGFCALAERAAVQMMVDRGFRQDSYVLSSAQAADGRVYYSNCENELGVGMGVMMFTHEVSTEEVLEDFWSAARKYHMKFKEEHRQMAGIQEGVIEDLCKCTIVESLPTEGLTAPSKKMSYYATTNMRDLTGLLHGIGEKVQLEYIDRLTTMHLFPMIWMNTFNTFRGRFLHSLQYNSHTMSDDVAEQYSDLLFSMFSDVC